MNTCPECHAAVDAHDAACPACGASLEAARECPNCGTTTDAAEPACLACGALLTAARCDRHPDREAQGRCVVCASPVCPACDIAGKVHYLCPDHHDVEVIEGWAQVYSTPDEVDAQLIRDNLIGEGIDAEILSQKDHFTVTVDLGDLSQVRVLVPAFSYAAAAACIARHHGETGVHFACPACGEAYEPGTGVCTACGTPLPVHSA